MWGGPHPALPCAAGPERQTGNPLIIPHLARRRSAGPRRHQTAIAILRRDRVGGARFCSVATLAAPGNRRIKSVLLRERLPSIHERCARPRWAQVCAPPTRARSFGPEGHSLPSGNLCFGLPLRWGRRADSTCSGSGPMQTPLVEFRGRLNWKVTLVTILPRRTRRRRPHLPVCDPCHPRPSRLWGPCPQRSIHPSAQFSPRSPSS